MKLTRAMLLIAGLMLIAVGTFAQEPATDAFRDAPSGVDEPRLRFEREVFEYPNAGRRDPFRALTRQDETGPQFADLVLRMIIHSDVASQSLVVVADGTGRTHRLRRGDAIGNATVIDIGPNRVVFSVEDLGTRRQEALELKKNQLEGA
jgi:hypothetical protein